MIRNFDKETCPLNDYEQNIVMPKVVSCLKSRVGRAKAISSTKILGTCLADCMIDAARLRKVINYIRTKGLIKCLMATSKGYYIAENREELESYIESLQGREDSIRELRRSIRKQMNKVFSPKEE